MKRAAPKASRNSTRTRSRILNESFAEIYRKGFRNSNITEIVGRLQLTKGAFFHHFPTKEDLGYTVVDEILKPLVVDRWIKPLDEYENALDGILQNFKRIIVETPEEHLALGCPLNNLIQEIGSQDPIFREKLGVVLESWIRGIELNLKRAQMRGYVRHGVNMRRLAEFIVMCHEGAFGMVKSGSDRKTFLGLHSCLRDYLEGFRVVSAEKRRVG